MSPWHRSLGNSQWESVCFTSIRYILFTCLTLNASITPLSFIVNRALETMCQRHCRSVSVCLVSGAVTHVHKQQLKCQMCDCQLSAAKRMFDFKCPPPLPKKKTIINISVPKVINVHRDRFSVILIESIILCHEGGFNVKAILRRCWATKSWILHCRFVFDQCSLRNKTTLAQ